MSKPLVPYAPVYRYCAAEDEEGHLFWKRDARLDPENEELDLPAFGDVSSGSVCTEFIPMMVWPGSANITAIYGESFIRHLMMPMHIMPGTPKQFPDWKEEVSSLLKECPNIVKPDSTMVMDTGRFILLKIWLADAAPSFLNEVIDETMEPRMYMTVCDSMSYDSLHLPSDAERAYTFSFCREPLGDVPMSNNYVFSPNYGFRASALYRLVMGLRTFTDTSFPVFVTSTATRLLSFDEHSPDPDNITLSTIGTGAGVFATMHWYDDDGRPSARYTTTSRLYSLQGRSQLLFTPHYWNSYYETLPWESRLTYFLDYCQGACFVCPQTLFYGFKRFFVETIPRINAPLVCYPRTDKMQLSSCCGISHSSTDHLYRKWNAEIPPAEEE